MPGVVEISNMECRMSWKAARLGTRPRQQGNRTRKTQTSRIPRIQTSADTRDCRHSPRRTQARNRETSGRVLRQRILSLTPPWRPATASSARRKTS